MSENCVTVLASYIITVEQITCICRDVFLSVGNVCLLHLNKTILCGTRDLYRYIRPGYLTRQSLHPDWRLQSTDIQRPCSWTLWSRQYINKILESPDHPSLPFISKCVLVSVLRDQDLLLLYSPLHDSNTVVWAYLNSALRNREIQGCYMTDWAKLLCFSLIWAKRECLLVISLVLVKKQESVNTSTWDMTTSHRCMNTYCSVLWMQGYKVCLQTKMGMF